MPEYIRNEAGLLIRQYPHKNKRDRDKYGARFLYERQEGTADGQIRQDHAPDEVGSSTHANELKLLKEAIRTYNQHRREQPAPYEDGWY